MCLSEREREWVKYFYLTANSIHDPIKYHRYTRKWNPTQAYVRSLIAVKIGRHTHAHNLFSSFVIFFSRPSFFLEHPFSFSFLINFSNFSYLFFIVLIFSPLSPVFISCTFSLIHSLMIIFYPFFFFFIPPSFLPLFFFVLLHPTPFEPYSLHKAESLITKEQTLDLRLKRLLLERLQWWSSSCPGNWLIFTACQPLCYFLLRC